MKINYKNDKIRKLCNTQREAVKKLGQASARKLRTRLADIDAGAHVGELITGRPHPLTRDREGQFAVDLTGGHRLVFMPDHDPIPLDDNDKTDWSQVTDITIVYIGDYHD